MVLREKEKQFIFDEVCPLKFHCGKLMMLGTIGVTPQVIGLHLCMCIA
jgi:hypothetical protein